MTKITRPLACILSVLLAVFLLVGCGSTQTAPATDTTAQQSSTYKDAWKGRDGYTLKQVVL